MNSKKSKKEAAGTPKAKSPQAKDVPVEKLQEIVARSSEGPLAEEERELLTSAVDTLGFLTTAIENKNVTLAKLRSYLFGSATESSKNILGRDQGNGGDGGEADRRSKQGISDIEVL